MVCPNCNEKEHEPNARFCHVCGHKLDSMQEDSSRESLAHGKRVQETWDRLRLQRYDEDENYGFRWAKVLRYLLLLAILIENIIISIKESYITDDDGVHGYAGTTIFANIFIFTCTIAICVFANMGHFEDKKLGLRIYYEWLHFLTAALMPILGFWFVSNMQNGWTLLLDGILVGIVLLVDFVMPDLID